MAHLIWVVWEVINRYLPAQWQRVIKKSRIALGDTGFFIFR